MYYRLSIYIYTYINFHDKYVYFESLITLVFKSTNVNKT